MSVDDLLCAGLLVLGAVVAFVDAALFKYRKPKAMYLPGPRWSRPRYWWYGAWPLGLGCLLTIIGMAAHINSLMWIGLVGFTLLSLVFSALRPRWVEPKWMSWLRDRYDWTTLEFMFDQASQNPSAWTAQVCTQEGLERWAREMECLVWLKGRYGSDEVDFMLAEARLDDDWTERVLTEEGLIVWAEEMEVQFRERRQARRPWP